MWFKNLQIYRLPAPWNMSAEQLEACLTTQAFAPCTSLDLQSQGWVAPRPAGALVHRVHHQMLITLMTEKKLLPATVINQVAKARAVEIEEQQGFKPGRKQMKELKEQISDELLPRAFSIQRDTRIWIDPVNGWLVVDSSSPAKADEVLKLLLKAVDPLPLSNLHVVQAPLAAMTSWLAADAAPAGFTVDAELELRASGDSKATVRYARQAPEADDLRRHIAAGKQCTRLALTWNDRISFVLTESLALKRLAPLDVITENANSAGAGEDERFDGDFALMSGELHQLLSALVQTLGGEMPQTGAAATH